MKRLLLAATILSLSSPALAQSKRDLADTDRRLAQRLDVLEQRFLTGDPAAERLMQRVDAMEMTIRSLRGELEKVTFERDQAQGDLRALADDVRRIQELETRMRIHLDAVDMVAAEAASRAPAPVMTDGPPTIGAVTLPPQVETQPGVPSPTPVALPAQPAGESLAELGQKQLREGDFGAAQVTFKKYITGNPEASDVGEAQYWLGETYFVRGGYADAADSYIASMRKDPKGAKAPEAMVRLGASLRELGKKAEACRTLQSFPAQYPDATEAAKAKASTELARTGC